MVSTLRALAVLTAAASLAGASAAQGPSTAGTTPGTGHVTLDLTAPQPAECLGQTDGPWTLVAPYGWIFGMKGTVGAGRLTAQVDLTVGDAVKQLDNLKGAAQLHVESGYGPVGVIADLTYMNIQPADGLVTVDSRST